jgi:hypothetical protein
MKWSGANEVIVPTIGLSMVLSEHFITNTKIS